MRPAHRAAKLLRVSVFSLFFFSSFLILKKNIREIRDFRWPLSLFSRISQGLFRGKATPERKNRTKCLHPSRGFAHDKQLFSYLPFTF